MFCGRGPGSFTGRRPRACSWGVGRASSWLTRGAEGGRQRAADHVRPHREREGRAGLVVQYWFFYYFNQFNDLHEGDWEGMQIAFDANSAREALAEGPY